MQQQIQIKFFSFRIRRIYPTRNNLNFTAELCTGQSHGSTQEVLLHKVPNVGMIPCDPPDQINLPSANDSHSHTAVFNSNQLHASMFKTKYYA